MVLLLTDVFLLLTQVLLWILVALATWFVLLQLLPRVFLGSLVLLLILAILVLSFFGGTPVPDGGVVDVLWRIISFPFSPLGLGIILLAVLLSGRKLPTLWRRIINLVLVLLLIGSTPIASYFLARELEFEAIEEMQPTPALTAGARRVIVLLGEGTTRVQLRPPRDTAPATPPRVDRPISPEVFQVLTLLPTQLTERGDRLLYAGQLYQEEARAGAAPLIVVSAGNRFDRRRREGERAEEVSEARDIQQFLTERFAVPEGDIRIDTDGVTVRRSAEQVQRLLADQQINFGNQLTIVTSALNMSRTAWTFANVFPEATIVARPTDFYTLPPPESLGRLVRGRDLIERELRITDFVPNADSFYLSSQVADEYLRSLFYFLRGWIRPFQRRI